MSAIVTPEYHHFTLASLATNGSDRPQFEEWCETYAPHVVGGRQSYDDLLDRLDGSTWNVYNGRRVVDVLTVDLPTSFSDPVWRKLRSILSGVIRECVA